MSIENLSSVNSTSQKALKTEEQEPVKEKRNYNWLKNTGSIMLAAGGYKAADIVGKKLVGKAGTEFSKETMFSSFIINGRKAKEIFNASGLAEKGVRLQNVEYTRYKTSCMNKYLKDINSLKISSLKENYIAATMENAKNTSALGLNSFYDPRKKTIINNFKRMATAIPHEMGHAANYTSKNPLLKILTKARYLQLLVPVILTVAILRKPKKEGEESTTIIGKGLDFVKENSVALTAGCMLPTVAEEGLASIRGAKMAKKFLTPEKLKSLNVINFKGWATYAIAAGATIGAVWLANKIRNATTPKTEQERDTRYKQTEELDKVA